VRIRYIVPIANKRKVIIPDHWDFPMQGGALRVIEEEGLVTALEVVYQNQSIDLAPTFEKGSDGAVKYSITRRDVQLPFIQIILNNVTSFLQCYFDIGLAFDDIEVKFEGESPEEEKLIAIKSMKVGKYEEPIFLTFDMLTRALMASEKSDGPRFEAALIYAARSALSEQRFIDSFRYSFLLIESLYGEGRSKMEALKDDLKKSMELRSIIEIVLSDPNLAKGVAQSDTSILLGGKPSVDDVIGHLVDKRGFYFHGNVKRKDAWKPEQQEKAKALAFFTIDIAYLVAQKAAASMFDEKLSKKHFESAQNAGAMIVFQIKYAFRIPGESFSRDGQMNIRVPGTKVTPKLAFGVAQHFLQQFEHSLPTAGLDHAGCEVQGTGQKVFDMKFYNEPSA
jgi:hypothetical protein